MKLLCSLLSPLSLVSVLACAPPQQPDQQDPPPKPAPAAPAPAAGTEAPSAAARAVLAEMREQFEKEGIRFDAEGRKVVLDCVVNQPGDPIEYLLIGKRGKRHEAVFWTKAKPSVLNAALLLLGLEPGKNATYVEKDPPPTREEIEQGADPLIITPPSGMKFWMTARWRVDEEQVVEVAVEDLLLDMTTQEPVVDASWVFLGGRMAPINRGEPDVFVADVEFNLISVCYLTPDNHLATMAHERARDDQNWWLTTKLPAPDTPVQLVFHRAPTPLHEQRAKRSAPAEGEQKKSDEPKPDGGR